MGKEFERWHPSDWKEQPEFINKIRDADLRQWGQDLHGMWKLLGRKMKADVLKNSNLYSILPVQHPIIVPGGRFREFYYWDSYWIIRGLLFSEMKTTVKGMLENFLSLVDRYGFIPNGGRLYYKHRSQPPLLAGMVKSYVDFTNDTEFIMKATPILEQEFEYWMKNNSILVRGYDMFIYRDTSSGPRPESYREDFQSATKYATEEEKEEHYGHIKGAAASGWDFSSRWFINDNGTNVGTLANLKTGYIVPVDLTAILHWNARILAEMYQKLNNCAKARFYEIKASKIFEVISSF